MSEKLVYILMVFFMSYVIALRYLSSFTGSIIWSASAAFDIASSAEKKSWNTLLKALQNYIYFLRTLIYAMNAFVGILITKGSLLSVNIILQNLSFITVRNSGNFYPVVLSLLCVYLFCFSMLVVHWMLLLLTLLLNFPKLLTYYERVCHFVESFHGMNHC